jgi:hypothetical protein
MPFVTGLSILRGGPSDFLFLHNLPFADERGLFIPEINLIVQTVRLVDDSFDYSVDDSTGVHADADVVADFGLFTRHADEDIALHAVRSTLTCRLYASVLPCQHHLP